MKPRRFDIIKNQNSLRNLTKTVHLGDMNLLKSSPELKGVIEVPKNEQVSWNDYIKKDPET